MTYKQLVDFIENKMRMSHIYQPVMLMALLKNGGRLADKEVAKALLEHDESQIEYYTQITKAMPGKVLRQHGIVTRDQAGKAFALAGYEGLSEGEIKSLVEKCEARLEAYIERRGRSIFDHRRKSTGYISGTLRYDVLKRSKFHCELCGVSADEKALEVDHILPRNCGGSDDMSNLQALCYSCNAMKCDRDDTDFRLVREAYSHRDSACIFCSIPGNRVEAGNELAFVIADGYPVTPLHKLVIPKRHVANYFDLGQAEINACTQLLHATREAILQQDSSVSGFNIGVNDGEAAGQTISHCHVHLIPRRSGDVQDPRGGVRGAVPEKRIY